VTFPNPDRVLMPGQFVKVRFKGSVKTDVILVPQRAVQQGPSGSVVYVLAEGDKIAIRDVKAAGWQGSQWLIEEGLHSGDRVVVDGMQRLAPGAQVKPVAVASAGSQAMSSSGPSAAVSEAAAPVDAAEPETKREGTP